MHSESYWLRKEILLKEKIIKKHDIGYRDITNPERYLLMKLGIKLNDIKMEFGIKERNVGGNCLPDHIWHQRKKDLIDYIKKNPRASSANVRKKYQYTFNKLYKNIKKLRDEADTDGILSRELINYIIKNPYTERKNLPKKYKITLNRCFKDKLDYLKKEIGILITRRNIDNLDRVLNNYSISLKLHKPMTLDDAVIENSFDLLKEREKRIIELRYGIGGNSYTLEEIGVKYDITRERVRTIILKAKEKLETLIKI